MIQSLLLGLLVGVPGPSGRALGAQIAPGRGALLRIDDLGGLGGGTFDWQDRLVIGDRLEQEVRVIGPDGGEILRFGRRGDGPGEFAYVNRVFATPLQLLVWDTRRRDLSRFDLDGRFRYRTFPETPAGVQRAGTVVAVLGNGNPIVQWGGIARRGFARDTVTLSLHDSTGAVRRVIGRYPADEMLNVRVPDGSWIERLPESQHLSVSACGGEVAISTGEATIDIHRLQNPTPERIDLASVLPAPATPADLQRRDQAWLRMRSLELRDNQFGTSLVDSIRAALPEHRLPPRILALHHDTNCQLWIVPSHPPTESGRLLLLNGSHRDVVRILVVPVAREVLAVGRDWFATRTTDADGVVIVEGWRRGP
jgi:hypothetical protein